MASAMISKGIKLSYKTSSTGSTYTDLANLQSIPSLGGTVDSIEITTLDDAAHAYTNGLISYGDSLDFVFLYTQEQFQTLSALNGQELYWQVGLPDGTDGAIDTTATFTGASYVSFDALGVNAAATYTLSIKPTSEITFA